MALRIYNTLSRRKEEFRPLYEGFVGIYVCGPTVYDHLHVGHAKSYISFDVVVRYLRHLGYKVRYVQNITDVGHLTDNADQGEDKIEKRAAAERLEPMELVEIYMRSYFEDMDALGNLRPNISPRASGHIPEQIELVKVLLDRGYAYEVGGSVYFSVEKFGGYGKLSGRRFQEQWEAVRIAPNPEKRHPADFALWKRAEPGHILRWPSPWGWGYPGWHLECSAMSMKYLGETLDIHGGGMENMFPHHECEIAQSEAATGKPFVRYWMHNNMVTVGGTKMGKSLGNFVTIKEILKSYSPMVLRLFVLGSHYRSPVDYTEEAMRAAQGGWERLNRAVQMVRERIRYAPDGPEDVELSEVVRRCERGFSEAMDDDFNTPKALGALFELTGKVLACLESGTPSRATLKKVEDLYSKLAGGVLGFKFEEEGEGREEELLDLLVEVRAELRRAKDWKLADRIRERLRELGIALEDRPEGTVWRRYS